MIVELNGVRIFYIEEGLKEDPVLLYIHGNLGSSGWFQKVMNFPGYKTVALDMPNFGKSNFIDEMDIDTYADYTAKFLQKILKENNKDSAVVAGHSLGAAVAVSLAVRYPGLASKLILVDPPPLEGLITPKEHYPYIEKYQTDKQLLKTALKSVTPGMDDDPFLDNLTDDAFRMNGKAFIGHAKSLESFNYSDRVTNFKEPVLVIVGEKDILISNEMGKAVTDSFPNGEYKYVEGIGHSIIVEDPDMFIEIVENFLIACK